MNRWTFGEVTGLSIRSGEFDSRTVHQGWLPFLRARMNGSPRYARSSMDERMSAMHEDASSILAGRTRTLRVGRSSIGRAPDCGSGGHGFEPHRSTRSVFAQSFVSGGSQPILDPQAGDAQEMLNISTALRAERVNVPCGAAAIRTRTFSCPISPLSRASTMQASSRYFIA